MNAGSSAADTVAVRHLALSTAAVVAGLLELLDAALGHGFLDRDDVWRRFPFLDAVTDSLAELAGDDPGGSPEWFEDAAAQVAAEASQPPPLANLVEVYGDPAAASVLVAAALVERDVRFGPVFALLQAPNDASRPCAGIIAALLQRPPAEIIRLVEVLAADGVVEVDDGGALRIERPVRLPPVVLDLLEGHAPAGLLDGEPPELVGSDDLRSRVGRAAAMLADGQLDRVIARGSAGSGRRTVLRTIAAHLGRPLLVAEATDRHAPAVAVLTGAMLAWEITPTLGQLAPVPPAGRATAVGVVTGRRGAVAAGSAGERSAVIDLPTPDVARRRRFWSDAGTPADDEVLDTLARHYVLSGGAIGQIATKATAIARLDGRSSVRSDDVRHAAQDRGRQQVESLAELLAPIPPTRRPVLAGATAAAYDALLMRSRHREQLGPSIGGPAASGVGRGVRAMLSGPSGTGKTLTARSLGAALDLDVYRANLAALVDKYIGETERRFDDLLSRCEELDVVLLVDEGDAVLAQRTEVRSSNDRYANLETDFFLQRLESYEGIVLITTNAPHLIDSAFQRRLDIVIGFGPPGPAERAAIWEQHLPERHTVSRATVAMIAERCRMTGGQIRNVTLHAALLALDGGRLVDDDAVTAAVDREFALVGQTSPLTSEQTDPSPFERALARR